MEERNPVKRFDEDSKLVNFLFGEYVFEMLNENKKDIAEMIYSDKYENDIKDYVDIIKDFFKDKISELREYKKQLDNNIAQRRELHWWQLIKRFFLWWQRKQIVNNMRMCKEELIIRNYTNFTQSLTHIDTYLETQHSKKLPEEEQLNKINAKNDHKTNPINKVVKENLEMTEKEKQNQDYIGYLNRINGKGKKNQKRNIDETK